MPIQLTPTLKDYALLSQFAMIGGGKINIRDGNYGSGTSTYNVTITSTGNPSGTNPSTLPTASGDGATLIQNIISEPTTTTINNQNPLSGTVTYTPGKTNYTSSLIFDNDTIIQFQGNSSSIFIIYAPNIQFKHNISVQLGGVDKNNIFWFVTNNTIPFNISFYNTSTLYGVFIGKIQTDYTTIYGHVYSTDFLDVQRILSINQPIIPPNITLTPILNSYALAITTGIFGDGTINIKDGMYGSVTPTYNVTITSTGTPSGVNSQDLPTAFTELTTLDNNIKYYPTTTVIDQPELSGKITYTPGKTIYYNFTNGLIPLVINENTEITFNAGGNSSAIFIIFADSFIFRDNSLIRLLNGADQNKIFWIVPINKNITFQGTSTVYGTFIGNQISVSSLNLYGHMYATNNFFVYDTLNINIIMSDICFAKNTPIQTDQGIVMIQELKTGVHTIGREPIVAITKTISLDDFLICFEKHTFERNCPSQRTIVSKEHKIQYNDKMISAHKLMLPRFENFVHKIPYDGQPLYNILLKKHGTVLANNLVCETLNPKSIIAQLYANHILTKKHVVKMNEGMMVNHEIKKKNMIRNLHRF